MNEFQLIIEIPAIKKTFTSNLTHVLHKKRIVIEVGKPTVEYILSTLEIATEIVVAIAVSAWEWVWCPEIGQVRMFSMFPPALATLVQIRVHLLFLLLFFCLFTFKFVIGG